METYEFLKFLPSDNEFTRGQGVCKEMSEDFQRLLKLNPSAFWKVVASNKHLNLSLESFLRHSQRPYDFVDDQSQGISTMQSSVGQLLSRRVFLVLIRIATTAEEGKGAPPRQKRSEIIRNTGVLSLPILLDACAVFGTTNADLLGQMIRHLFQSQPLLLKDLLNMGPVIGQNLTEVGLRCKDAMEGEVTGASSSSSSHTEHLDVETLMGIRDGVDYMRDMCQTLSSFTEMFPDGAAVLIAGGEDLVDPLASIYDDLLPDVLQRIQEIQTNSSQALWVTEIVEQITKKCRHIELVLLLFVGTIIRRGYLSDTSELVSQLESVGCQVPILKEPVLRGEVLMNCMMNISQPELTQRDHGTALLMQAVNNRFRIDQLAAEASEKGYLYLDIQQLDYLLVILGSTRSLTSLRSSASANAQQTGKTSNTKGKKNKNEKPKDEVDQAMLDSRIQQIKDIFPDYGEGFLECCLNVYGNNPEQVIDHLLSGSLAPQLKSLDTGLKTKPKKEEFPQLGNRSDNVLAQPNSSTSKWTNIVNGQQQQQQQQQQQKKKTVSKSVAKTMDLQNYDEKDVIRRHAEVAVLQWEQEQEQEYDDEYDDTYDDAMDAGADAGADVKGDKFIPQSSIPEQGGNSWQSNKPKKIWLADGKVYNYKKQGATEVKYKNEENIQLAMDVAGGDHIHGMGRGGNKAMIARQQEYQQSMQDNHNDSNNNNNNNGSARGRGRGQPNYARKDKNKHAIGNHHRKERAMKKMGRGM